MLLTAQSLNESSFNCEDQLNNYFLMVGDWTYPFIHIFTFMVSNPNCFLSETSLRALPIFLLDRFSTPKFAPASHIENAEQNH